MIIKSIVLGNTNVAWGFLGSKRFYQRLFEILNLFRSGEQGVWLEPTDITTLYQDIAGTIPVTTSGDPVGLVKDKSGNNTLITQSVSAARVVYNRGDDRGEVNLITWSEDFTKSAWIPSSKLITSNAILSPTGAMTGTKIVATNTLAFHSVAVSIPKTSDVVGSVYAKAAELDRLLISVSDGASTSSELVVDLTTGNIIRKGSRITSASVTAVGDGWYRVTVGYLNNISTKIHFCGITDSSTYFTGDGTSGIYIWGAQLEAGLTASDYQHNIGFLGGIGTGADTDVQSLTLDKVDDALVIAVPTGGYVGTMTVASTRGTATYGVDIPGGNFKLGGPNFPINTIVGTVIRTGALTAEDELELDEYFIEKGAVKSFLTSPTMYNYWMNWTHLTNFPLIDTSSTTRFYSAWYGCSKLTSFPLIDTSNAENLDSAWFNCLSLTSFPAIDTSKVTSFWYTWLGCKGMTTFPLIDTSSATNLYSTWSQNSSLTSFPSIDTSKVTLLSGTWNGCSALTSFPEINTALVTNMSSAWSYCRKLTNVSATLNTASVTGMNSTWRSCSSLTSFPPLNTGKVKDFDGTWSDCTGLTEFPLLDTSAATKFRYVWYGCTGLTNFPAINTVAVIDMSNAWGSCSNLTNFPNINTSNVTDMSGTWSNCSALPYVPTINTTKVTTFRNTWYRCSALTSFPVIDTSSAVDFSYTWLGCNRLTDFPANMFNNIKGGDFTWAFISTALTQTSIDNILTSLVTSGVATGIRKFNQSGGSAPSITGTNAIDTLRLRGWTVTVTGGY